MPRRERSLSRNGALTFELKYFNLRTLTDWPGIFQEQPREIFLAHKNKTSGGFLGHYR
jgi:hypothetical protein